MKKSIEFILMTVLTVSVLYWPTAEELQEGKHAMSKQYNASTSRAIPLDLRDIKQKATTTFNENLLQRINDATPKRRRSVFAAYHNYRKKLLDEGISASNIPLLSDVESIFNNPIVQLIENSRSLVFELENLFEKLDRILEKPLGPTQEGEPDRTAVKFLKCAKQKRFDPENKNKLPSFDNVEQLIATELKICANQVFEQVYEGLDVFRALVPNQTKNINMRDAFLRYYNEFLAGNDAMRDGLPLYEYITTIVIQYQWHMQAAHPERLLNEF